jgi:hypothetical protein
MDYIISKLTNLKKVLLFAAFAISMNASAQDLPSTFGMHYQVSNIKKNLRTGLNSLQLNDSIYTWRWDVDITGWTAVSKIINMSYDANNNLTFFTTQDWDGNAWVNSDQYAYTYDSSSNLTLFTFQDWYGSVWENSYQYTYAYDSVNNLVSRIYQYWDGNSWVNEGQYNYTYDANNNKISEILVYGGYSSYSYTWTYNTNHKQISEFYESPWGSYLIRWIYDGNSRKICEIYQGLSGDYTDKYRWNYFYDSHRNIQREEHWGWYNNAWGKDFDYNYLYTYNGNNNKESEIKTKDQGFFSKEYLYKYAFAYDNDTNLVSQFTGGWLGNSWVNYLHDTYTFDGNKNQTSHVYQELNESTWMMVDQWLSSYEDDHFIAGKSYKHFNLNDPETVVTDGDSTHYYFHTISTAINDFMANDDNFNVYPNPSSGKFTISSESAIRAIEIYNLLGERVYIDSKFNDQTSYEINLSSQVKGIYIINIYVEQFMKSKKIAIH